MKTRSILISLIFLIFLISLQDNSLGDIPRNISYQGLLTIGTGNPVPDDLYDLAFKIYNTETGVSALWIETHPAVPVIKGIFNVILGSITSLSLPFDQQYWLGISVDGGAELAPRTKLVSAPYSLNARSVSDEAITTAKLAGNSVTKEKIADNQVVKSLNSLKDNISLIGGNNVTVTTGSNSLTISSQSNDSWKLNGNTGNGNFLGTTDDKPLEFRVNNSRALMIQPKASSPNIIAGYEGNLVSDASIYGATISGGGKSGMTNRVYENFGTISGGTSHQVMEYGTVSGGHRNTARAGAAIGGGKYNEALGNYSTIGGGYSNLVYYGDYGTIAGGGPSDLSDMYGTRNKVTDDYCTIGGGGYNLAGNDNVGSTDAAYASVSGGLENAASGKYSTVPGGRNNTAGGLYSFAAGFRAKANHNGCFVWADSANTDVASSGNDQFIIRANGGVRVFNSESNTALYVETNGTGRAGHFRITNASSSSNVVAASTQGSGDALEGYTTGAGNALYARTDGSGWAGYFYGYGNSSNGVYITTKPGKTGLQVVGGTKNAVVRTSQGARALYSEEATEVWFSDYGFGCLENGRVTIQIDRLFIDTVNLEEPYHVFIQLNDADCEGVAVTSKTSTSFDVLELRNGRSNAEFSYRIVAKRRGYEDERLEHREMAEDDPNL